MNIYQRVCEECQRPFEAHRARARFCSNACRQRHWRKAHGPNYRALVLADDGPVEAEGPLVREDEIADVVVRLRGCAATLSAAALTGPPELRPCCSRLERSLLAALEAEGL